MIGSLVIMGLMAVNGCRKNTPVTPDMLPPDGRTTRPGGNPAKTPVATSSPFTIGFTSDKTIYQRGEPVVFTISLENTNRAPQVLTFNTGQNFDIAVAPQGQENRPVWRWSHGKMFTMAIRRETLAPGKRLTWTETWKQVTNEGRPIEHDTYTTYIASAVITANGRIQAAPVVFQITDKIQDR